MRALAHRNFRLYLSGQGISLIGTWTQQVAMGWLAYRLSGSAVWLGVIGFSGQIPILLFASFGGVWSDRFDRHRLLFWTQALAMAQALLLAALVLGHVVQIWHLVVLAAVLGVVNAVDAPLRQSFVVQLVDDRADLPNAIALNSLAINSSRLVGPAAAGFLISWLGEGVCFLLNGLSYVAVLWALRRMKTTAPQRRRSSMREGLKDGFSYAFGFPPVRALLLMMAVLGLTIVPYMVLMPVYAKHVFHGDAQTLGLLMGSAGLGALTGAVFLTARRSVVGLGKVIAAAALCAGLALAGFAFSTRLALSLPLLVVVGFGLIVSAASTNMLLQTLVEDHLRGRVMALFTMSFLGMAPVGSLLAGIVAHHLGAPLTLFINGVLCVLAALYFASRLPGLRRHAHPVFQRRGLVPKDS